MKDQDLADRIRAGDREAASELVQAHYQSVLRFLWVLCRNADDAGELTQDTFLKALGKIAKFRGESGLRTWLHQIAYHAFMNRRRRRKGVALSSNLPASPFESLSTLALDLEVAVCNLPDTAREAFVLCEIQQFSVKEASEILGVPEGTVKSRVHTARVQLRRALSAHDATQEQQEVDYVL
jgi:RNA polymerase sigma-70 factor (ECF subfamily)